MRRAHVYHLLSVAIITVASLGAFTAFATLVVHDLAGALNGHLPGDDGRPRDLSRPAPVAIGQYFAACDGSPSNIASGSSGFAGRRAPPRAGRPSP